MTNTPKGVDLAVNISGSNDVSTNVIRSSPAGDMMPVVGIAPPPPYDAGPRVEMQFEEAVHAPELPRILTYTPSCRYDDARRAAIETVKPGQAQWYYGKNIADYYIYCDLAGNVWELCFCNNKPNDRWFIRGPVVAASADDGGAPPASADDGGAPPAAADDGGAPPAAADDGGAPPAAADDGGAPPAAAGGAGSGPIGVAPPPPYEAGPHVELQFEEAVHAPELPCISTYTPSCRYDDARRAAIETVKPGQAQWYYGKNIADYYIYCDLAGNVWELCFCNNKPNDRTFIRGPVVADPALPEGYVHEPLVARTAAIEDMRKKLHIPLPPADAKKRQRARLATRLDRRFNKATTRARKKARLMKEDKHSPECVDEAVDEGVHSECDEEDDTSAAWDSDESDEEDYPDD